jgi:hypothetical protein
MDLIIAAKISIGALGTIAAVIITNNERLLSLGQRDFDRLLYGLALVSRLGLFILAYVVLGFQAQSDALVYYYWSQLVLSGHVPGESETLPLHYGPLFLYLTASPLLLVDSSRTIVAFMTAIEIMSIPIWLAVARIAFTEVAARRAILLYVASPFALLTSVIGANNDVIVSIFVAAGMWLFFTNRQILSAFVLGLGIAGSKLLVAAALPALILKARQPVGWCSIFAAVPLIAYGTWFLIGIDPISGLRFHTQHFSSGNIPFLLGLLEVNLLDGGGRIAANVLSLVIFAGIAGLAFFQRSHLTADRICALLGALFAAFMLTSAKAFAHYWLIVLVPVLCVLASEKDWRWPLLWYVVFSLTASVESTLWFRLLDSMELSTIARGAHGARDALWLFLPVEILLIASYGMFLFYCCRRLLCAASN